MTISSDVSYSGPYNGNGVTTAFPYNFKAYDASHLSVYLIDADTGERELVSPSAYGVSGVGSPSGGNVTFLVAPAIGKRPIIVLVSPFTQETDLENQGPYLAETVERRLDLIVQQSLVLKRDIDRAIKADFGSDIDPRLPPYSPGHVLAFDGAEKKLVAAPIAAGDISSAVDAARDYRDAAGEASEAAGTSATAAQERSLEASGRATAAEAAAAAAEAAAAAAEAARDAAFGDADVYADTAAGLAATTEGDQFQVVVDDEIIRYRHDAGPAATEVARMALALGLVKKGPDAVAQIGADMLGAVGLEWNPRTGLSLPGATASQVRDVLFQITHSGGIGLEWNRDGLHLPGASLLAATDSLMEVTDASGAVGLSWDAAGLHLPGVSVSSISQKLLEVANVSGAVGLSWDAAGLHLPGVSVSITTDSLFEITVNGHAVVMYIDFDSAMHTAGAASGEGAGIPEGPGQTIVTTWVEPWDDASQDAVVSWVSNSQSARTIYYKMAESGGWSPVASQWTRAWPWGGGRWVHSALVRNLSPATIYDIGWSGAVLRRKFRTAARSDVTIVWASDWHKNPTSLMTASSGVIAEQPDVIVLPGDLVGEDGILDAASEADYILFFEQLATYWTHGGAMLPLVMLIGNHELGGGVLGPIKSISTLAFDGDAPGRHIDSSYRVNIGREVAILAINTEWTPGDTVASQIPWLTTELAAAAETHRHITVTGHSPAFGVSASHPAFDTSPRTLDLRYLAWPVMCNHADKVRFYMCGHEHMMSATAPLATHFDAGLSDAQNYYRWTTEAETAGVRHLGAGPVGGSRLRLDTARCALTSTMDSSVRTVAAFGQDEADAPVAVGAIVSPTADRMHYWISRHNSDGTWSAKAKSIDGSIIHEITGV